PALPQQLRGADGDEHAYSSTFDQDTRVGKTIESLACRRGVDAQERGQLVGRGHRGVLRIGAVEDPVFDLLRHGDEQRLRLVEHAHLPVVKAATAAPWFITPLMNHATDEPSRGCGEMCGETEKPAEKKRVSAQRAPRAAADRARAPARSA